MARKAQSGFTLIELLIVMIIMGVLASIGIQAFIASQVKGRDTTRKGSLKAISQALELYYNDKGQYPKDDGVGSGTFTACYTQSQNGPGKCGSADLSGNLYNVFKDPLNTKTIYMGEYPSDPTKSQLFYYISQTGTQYQIYAHLQNDNVNSHDPAIITPSPATGGAPSCGPNAPCNYGVSSANIQP